MSSFSSSLSSSLSSSSLSSSSHHHHHQISSSHFHKNSKIASENAHPSQITNKNCIEKKKKMGKGNQIGEVDTNDVLNASVMKIIKASAKNCSEVDIMAVKERLKADPNYKLYKRRFRFIPKLMTFLSVSSVCA